MSSVPSVKSFWKTAVFLTAIAGFTAYYAKNKVTIRRRAQYAKDASSYDSMMQQRVRSGDSISTIRPGFPKEDGVEKFKRKSEYEGAGSSYMSRRHGDKFGFFSRWFRKDD
ncbi:DEKNAAC101526 [Brettanomyces naardenensis]|uniref:DEKNAAC101526 n=1 Tax=Brettanomyces naardenensis TaxID=13370 RepID=A0A448YIJ9_BRENA|nr:DEKNAAC101526 [Brettanomyces naardenensis]